MNPIKKNVHGNNNISGAIMPSFADSTFPCFGHWSLESMECARCLRCGTCMASLFELGEITERIQGILQERAQEKAALPEAA